MFELIPHDYITEIRLNRPPVNAMTGPFMEGLVAAQEEACAAGARGLVISGREGLFSAGLDVPELLRLDRDEIEVFWSTFFATLRFLAGSPVPVVAAITGHSPAGGAVLALHCDYRVAARGEFGIGLNEVSIGLPVPRNVFSVLEWVVGSRRAEQLVSTGRLLTPEEALEVGMVDELVEVTEVVPASIAWLQSLLALPNEAMNLTRMTARGELLKRLADIPTYSRIAADGWFADDTQRNLRQLVEQLGKK